MSGIVPVQWLIHTARDWDRDRNKTKLEYYPYDKYKSPHTETPTSNGEGGGGGILKSNTQSSKICLNFNLGGGGGGVFWNQIPEQGCSGEFGQKFTVCTETCLCITDSLSHTTYVETNNGSLSLCSV